MTDDFDLDVELDLDEVLRMSSLERKTADDFDDEPESESERRRPLELTRTTVAASGLALPNISEGYGVGGARGRQHFRVASGSACEVCSALDLIDLPGGPENQQKLRRICAMLNKLQRT